MSLKSLAERKKQFLEDCCGGGPTMSMGDAGYQSASPAEGPTAGYDPVLGNKKKKRVMDTVKKLKAEGYRDPDFGRMNRQAAKHDSTPGGTGKADEIMATYNRYDNYQSVGGNYRGSGRPGPKSVSDESRAQERRNRMRGRKKGTHKGDLRSMTQTDRMN